MIFRIDVQQRLHNQLVLNAWHVNCSAPPSSAQLEDLVDAIIEPFRARQTNQLTYEKLIVRRVDTPGGIGVDYVPTGYPVTGARPVATEVTFAAALLKGVSLDAVKPGRIRKFYAALGEDEVENGVLTSAAQTAWNTAVGTLQTYLNSNPDLHPVAVKYDGDPPSVDNRWNLIQSVSISPVVAVMGTRKIGRGR